ncbi:hypothetical protein D3C76_1296780 [compost metagenome]
MVQPQTTTEPIAASTATGPPCKAVTTFCCAAIATTTGMYMAPQKPTPISQSLVMPPRFCIHNRAQINRIIAIPTPPTLDLTPSRTPSMSPMITPASVQIASSATP